MYDLIGLGLSSLRVVTRQVIHVAFRGRCRAATADFGMFLASSGMLGQPSMSKCYVPTIANSKHAVQALADPHNLKPCAELHCGERGCGKRSCQIKLVEQNRAKGQTHTDP